MRYKKSGTPIDQIGRELGVAYVLGGSWRREGARVRISAELIQVRDQIQLWNDTYEREMSGMLALQSEVATEVAGALALKLLPSEQALLAKARTVAPEAYEAYLKGVQHRETITKEGFDAAEFYFNLAVDRDPDFAAAWAGIASVWNSRLQLGMASRQEAYPKAKAAVLKALALDDSEVEAYRIHAGILTWADWDFEAAARAWSRMLELNPSYAPGLSGYSHYLMNMGRPKEAQAAIERALELDPYNIRIQSFYAQVLLGARRYDDSIAAARKVLSIQPNTGVAITALTAALFKKGLYDELLALERDRWAKDPELIEALEKGRMEAGFPGAVKRFADILASRYGKPGGPRAYILANSYARAGDIDRVIEWLEKAYEEHDNNMPYIGKNPLFDLVRSDPRFQDLVRRVGLPPLKAT
jgi:tetratricopeptide (TPR) repeat protein